MAHVLMLCVCVSWYLSPTPICTISPGTRSLAMTDMVRDSRTTLALGGTSLFSASRDFSERYSCTGAGGAYGTG